MRGIASSPKSRRCDRIQAYVTPEEFALIMASSERAGLSMSEFARRVCLGFRIESREDQQARRELLKINADCSSKHWPVAIRNKSTDCSIRSTGRRLN